MLNLSSYVPSLEEFEQVPSPLMDGDGVAPVVEGAIVGALPTEGFPAPVEQSVVELPPALDPTPLQPLEAGIVQEEVIAENLDAEAGQLMGAQIALEGYGKLLRSAGKNMTRQSAAFMAVGMARANRILGVTSLGLENEESGSQVMAMQTAKVDEKGLGSKLKEVAEKIWEWLKEKYKQLTELFAKVKALFNKDKEKAVYLLAAADAVKSGNATKVKSLPAPAGLKTSQVLDAIHGEDGRSPKPAPKTISLPAALAKYVAAGDKLTLTPKLGEDALMEYLTDATAFTNAVNQAVNSWGADTTPEEVESIVEALIQKHMGKTKSYKLMGAATAQRTAEGTLVIDDVEVDGAVEIPLPSLEEVKSFLKAFDQSGDGKSKEMEAYLKAGQDIMSNRSFADEHVKSLAPTLVRLFRASGIDDSVIKINQYISKSNSAAIAACDGFIAAHGGMDGTISQEDFEALPSRGLSVIPGQVGSKQGVGAAVKAAWAKTKEFFARLWEQFRNWLSKIWERIFGEEKKVDMLLLTNEAIPDEGGAPSGQPLALPPGTGLKSVAAAKSLSGPSVPGEVPVDVTPEPIVETGSPLPKGYIYTDALKKLKLSSGYAFEPTIEESLITWFTSTYNPAVTKMWRDVTSMTNSNFDVGAFDTWGKVLTDMAAKVMAGAPVGEIPGGQSLVLNEGTIAFSFGGGNGTDSEPVKALNKRQIAQILARQKRAFRGLELAKKATDEQERLHEQFAAVIERLINNADEAKGQQYSAFYSAVNRLMCNTAVRQLATTIGSRFTARTDVMDEMIAARAKRG